MNFRLLPARGLRNSQYGSESEFQKPNLTVPNYLSNSESRNSDFGISEFALRN